MKRGITQLLTAIAVSAIGILGACNLQRCSEGALCSTGNTGPTALPSPSPSVAASVSPTPVDPCKPVIGVNVSGATEVQIGSVIQFHVTPVSPAGPLEGQLDFCNATRTVTPESVSPNLQCVGSCGGFGPTFLATAVGPFSVSFRVEGAVSQPFQGTVTR